MGKFYEGLHHDLSLFVRFGAWLNTAPERKEARGGAGEAPRLSRIEAIRARRKDPDFTPTLPPCDAGAHLLRHLYEVGPASQAGFGLSPIGYADLDAYSRVAGVELEPWEAAMIRRLSFEYCDEAQKATDPDRPPPWDEEDLRPDPRIIAEGIRETLRGLANAGR